MEFKKCSRCGNFYVSNGIVCPNCENKDTLEYSSFKDYIQNNKLSNLDSNELFKISVETGITLKNINRFITYEDFKNFNNEKTIESSKIKNTKL